MHTGMLYTVLFYCTIVVIRTYRISTKFDCPSTLLKSLFSFLSEETTNEGVEIGRVREACRFSLVSLTDSLMLPSVHTPTYLHLLHPSPVLLNDHPKHFRTFQKKK